MARGITGFGMVLRTERIDVPRVAASDCSAACEHLPQSDTITPTGDDCPQAATVNAEAGAGAPDA